MISLITKLWLFVKTKFLTKKFLLFGIIGVVNTGIHMAVYWVMFNPFAVGPFFSNTVAFIVASIFSYFANALLTFKPKHKSSMQFTAVMAVFLIRLIVSGLLTTGFDFIIQNWIGIDYAVHNWTTIIAPFFASALLIPIAYFALEFVFKATDISKEETQETK